jgi:hypothetical protein
VAAGETRRLKGGLLDSAYLGEDQNLVAVGQQAIEEALQQGHLAAVPHHILGGRVKDGAWSRGAGQGGGSTGGFQAARACQAGAQAGCWQQVR